MLNTAGFPSARCEGGSSVLPTLHLSCQCWDAWPLSFRDIWQSLSCCSPLLSPTTLPVCLVQSGTHLFLRRRPGDRCNDPYHYYCCVCMCERQTSMRMCRCAHVVIRGLLLGVRSFHLGETGFLFSKLISTSLPLVLWWKHRDYRCKQLHQAFSPQYRFWGSNSGHQSCNASTVPTGPSLQS